MSYKFVSIEYDSTEQALTVAAKLNAVQSGGAVRVLTKGRTLEVVPANVFLADIFTLFSKIRAGIVEFLRYSPGAREETSNV